MYVYAQGTIPFSLIESTYACLNIVCWTVYLLFFMKMVLGLVITAQKIAPEEPLNLPLAQTGN